MTAVTAQARLREARQRIAEMKARTRDLRPSLKVIAQEISDRIEAGFAAGTEPSGAKWEALKPKTLERKTAQGFSLTPLTRTGAMRRTAVAEPSGTHTIRMGVGSEAKPYAGFHQFGSDGGLIPQRKFLPVLGPKGGPYKLDKSGKMKRAHKMIQERIIEFIIGKAKKVNK